MFCKHCGTKIEHEEKFCHNCGNQISSASVTSTPVTEPIQAVGNIENTQATIKCGNCEYEGQGEKARSTIGQILAWLCVFFAPLITVIYFVATNKYKCPKCKSNFVGIKNKQGVFVSAKRSRLAVILVCTLIIGLLSTLAVVALGSARQKANDAKRLSDIKQIQTALELYYTDQGEYPTDSGILGSGRFSCLNASGWQLAYCSDPYMGSIPTDPIAGGTYTYTSRGGGRVPTYLITATLQAGAGGLDAGKIIATPEGIKNQ